MEVNPYFCFLGRSCWPSVRAEPCSSSRDTLRGRCQHSPAAPIPLKAELNQPGSSRASSSPSAQAPRYQQQLPTATSLHRAFTCMRHTLDFFFFCPVESPTTPLRHQQLHPLSQHHPGQLLKLFLPFNATPEPQPGAPRGLGGTGCCCVLKASTHTPKSYSPSTPHRARQITPQSKAPAPSSATTGNWVFSLGSPHKALKFEFQL